MHQLEYLMEVGMILDEEKRWKEAERTYSSVMDLAIRAVCYILYMYNSYYVIITTFALCYR